MDSLRKSFKSQGSYKYSSSWSPSTENEERPILAEDHDDSAIPNDRREVVVKIDGNSHGDLTTTASNKVWRGSSYDFWKEGHLGSGGASTGEPTAFSFPSQNQIPMAEISEDPPSRLISSFLHKQKANGAEMALDMDLEMEELKKPSSSTSASKELRVSFLDPTAEPPSSSSSSEGDDVRGHLHRRGGKTSPTPTSRDGAEVLRCTSNSSFQPASGLLRVKTRSRLMDPPPIPAAAAGGGRADDERKSGRIPTRSGLLKSGMIGKSSRYDEDEEDPFLDDDLPDDFNRTKFSTLTILQWVSLILILAALSCSLAIPVLERQTLWNLHLWKWEVLVLVVICGRLVSGWFIRIVVFFIERNFLLRKRVLYFVYGVRKAVQNCLWLGLVLLSWHYLFDKKVERETKSSTLPYVTKILFCLIVGTVCRLIKTLFVKVLASSFHVSTYFDRIQESLFNQYVIETLSGPPLIEIQHNREEEDRVLAEVQKLQNAGATIPNDLRAAALPCKSGRVIGGGGSGSGHGGMRKSAQLGVGKSIRLSRAMSRKDVSKQQQQQDAITIDQLHKLNQKNISAWNMKRLMRIVRNGTLTTLDEQVLHESREDESAVAIRSEFEAKIAAKKIFNNVAKPGVKYIYLVDLMRFMREDEARKTMNLLFEGADENSRVSRRCLKNWVVNAFRERRALSLTLNDTKTAVNKLHQMANVVVGIIVLALWLLILGIATTHFYMFLSSQVLLAAFMFGNTLKMIFEAIIFLFVMHPFDVGDRCEIDGVQMIVEEMNILTTIFLRFDNQKITYPNTVLATLPIGNYYRSPDMGESIDFCIHVSTPLEKIAIMKEKIIAYMENKKEHWYPGASVVLRDVDDMNRLKVSIWMRHRINFQDMGVKFARRELVVQEMMRVLKELDIEYRMLPVDMNIRNLPPVTSTRLPSNWTACS